MEVGDDNDGDVFWGDELFCFSTLGAPDRQKGDSAGLGIRNSEHLIFSFIFEATSLLLTILDYTRANFINNKSFLWSFALMQPKTCMKLWFVNSMRSKTGGGQPKWRPKFGSHVFRKFSSSLCRGATFRPGTTQKTGVWVPEIAFGLEGLKCFPKICGVFDCTLLMFLSTYEWRSKAKNSQKTIGPVSYVKCPWGQRKCPGACEKLRWFRAGQRFFWDFYSWMSIKCIKWILKRSVLKENSDELPSDFMTCT